MVSNYLKIPLKFMGAALVLSASTSLFAQQSEVVVSSSASGQAGDLVSVPIDFTANNHDVASMEYDINFDDTNLTLDTAGDGGPGCPQADLGPAVTTNGNGVNCTVPSPGVLRVLITAPFVAPTPPMPTGEIMSVRFNVNAGAPAQVYPLTTANTGMADTGGTDIDPANFDFVDGSLEVVSGPQSELSLTPASIDFGTVDLGVMPVTDTFTLENIGDAGTTITINDIVYSGDAAFTSSDNCTTLNAGDTCTATITFDTGTNGTYSGSIAVDSDATVNPTPSGTIDGVADSAPSLSINPPFGPVNLGTVVVGSSATANGSVSNAGSADGSITCNYTGDPEISVTPDLSGGVTVPAGDSVGFSISCAVPDTAVEGDTFSGTLSCSGDLTGTHDLSCGATEFVPLPVPTNSKWGLAILSLLVLMIGGLTVRFFRA